MSNKLYPLLPLLLLSLTPACGHMGQPDVIYIARHGQTEWNRLGRFQGDPDLDPVGYVNRFSLWQLLKDVPVHSIYTSERRRTRRTAELVARQHALKIQPRAALNEIEPGVFEGMCFSDVGFGKRPNTACSVKARHSRPEATLPAVRKLFKQAWADRLHGRFPLGQSFMELVQQVGGFVQELERGLRQRKVLVVGHGVVNRALLHYLMGWPAATVARLNVGNDQVFRVEGAASGAPQLWLYTPGMGWLQCGRSAPKPGARHLDCDPDGAESTSAPVAAPAPDAAAAHPAPAPAPAANPTPEPAQPAAAAPSP